MVEAGRDAKACLDVPAHLFGLLAAGKDGGDTGAEEGERQGLAFLEKGAGPGVSRLELPGHAAILCADLPGRLSDFWIMPG